MHKHKVIIDTDPGIDDLLAISIALNSPELDIVAISTVFGNVRLDNTTKNAKLICDMFDKDIKIIKGSEKPLFSDLKRRSNVHGEDGLGGLQGKFRKKVEEKNTEVDGVAELFKLIKESDEKVTIIALGPLTNIAKLLLTDESIHEKIKEIHIMGGGVGQGNINELVEFNFFSDSYAAKVVLTSDIPIYLSALNVTSKVYFTKEEFEALPTESLQQEFIKESVNFYINLDPYLHDIVSVLTLTRPELFTFEEVAMDVVTDPGVADGMSYILRDDSINKNIKFVDTDQRLEIVKHISNIVKEIN